MFSKKSFENRKSIEASTLCGCYYCLKIFPSVEVKRYLKDKNGDTAVCPKCGIDSVVAYEPESEKYNIEVFSDLLKQQHKISF